MDHEKGGGYPSLRSPDHEPRTLDQYPWDIIAATTEDIAITMAIMIGIASLRSATQGHRTTDKPQWTIYRGS